MSTLQEIRITPFTDDCYAYVESEFNYLDDDCGTFVLLANVAETRDRLASAGYFDSLSYNMEYDFRLCWRELLSR